ncbi:MAG: tRNA pseudouridine(55) synthase TruB [Betaproteobacteria bacterium]
MTDPRASHRVPRRRVDGVLLLDKDVGRSSNAVLQHAKRLFNAAKAGHTGTLDPLASGLLPICFGEATKFAQLLLDADKSYLAKLHLGVTTKTGDAEGEVIERREALSQQDSFEAVLPRFLGTISQQPPRHAALKYQGRSYYEYAREGVDIPRPAREVSIRSLRSGAWEPPYVELAVECSKGTYIRVLAEDIGAALGCGAHLAALRRTATGGFNLADAVTLDALETMSSEQRDATLLPADSPCAALPRCDLSTTEAGALLEGRSVARPAMAEGVVRAYSAHRFVGVAEVAAGVLRARRLLANSDG